MNEVATIQLDDSKLDHVLELITDGTHYRQIAEIYKCTLWKLFKFLHDPKHSARVEEAKRFAAHNLVDQAELVLAQAKDNYQLLMVARELAHHYRWKASMIHGRQYAAKKVIVDPDEDLNNKKEITIRVIEE